MAPSIDSLESESPSIFTQPQLIAKIGINGFGRIGRNVLRASLTRPEIAITAINHTCTSAVELVHLVRYDSTLGSLPSDMTVVLKTESLLLINGRHQINLISERDPKKINWQQLGVEYVVESTGKFTKRAQALEHIIYGGARRVIISAPSADSPTYVVGVNADIYNAADEVISCASCTTNCVTPVLKVVHDHFGVVQGLLTTVHASTQSQNVLDGYNKKNPRLGRTVFGNIIPTTTGAAKAIASVLPHLQGRVTGVSIRVPTTSVSMIDLTINTSTSTSLSSILDAFRHAAETTMAGILSVCDEELVSSDFRGNPNSAVVDVSACVELNSRFFKIIAWYDNEWGYSNRLLDLTMLLKEKLQE